MLSDNYEYPLDENNRIIVSLNRDNYSYEMIHKRLVNNNYKIINKWFINPYYHNYIRKDSIIKDLNLFQIENADGHFNAWYDYKKAKFIISQGVWDEITFGENNEYLKKHNCALASFTVKSDYEDDDIYTYDSAIDGKKMIGSFETTDGKYFAILDLNGKIRNNVLFKGESIYKISSVIQLCLYKSLDEFKNIRKYVCNELKKNRKIYYYEMINKYHDGNHSPYLDEKVALVLNKKYNDK